MFIGICRDNHCDLLRIGTGGGHLWMQ